LTGKVIIVRASDVAKLIAKPTPASSDELKFGKIFEEEVTYAFYLRDFMWGGVGRKFARKIAARMRAEGIYSRERMLRAYRMFSALLRLVGDIPARKPRSRAKAVGNVVIFAQPDLELDNEIDGCKYIEFKTYQLDDYARAQATVFSYVLEEPVLLVGLVSDSNGFYGIQKEVVDGSNFKLPEIPDDVGEVIEVEDDEEAVRVAEEIAYEACRPKVRTKELDYEEEENESTW